ncbi:MULTISPECIES: TPM domain-containing protein [unclassified Lysobacter]|uniref:TPM domain-containing protein n=1 Tax=unclassified Lysobacter TaxID=2635362 RepID=UPI001BEAC0E0|nr:MULTISPECIES: TPM domain-containing protein [unclassified Lysobacter]MBT2745903.1 TPM domain-containing protein [Lysobacter sp. ISL-42]MBT2749538.1 TPM domain-containing protein [Lysobacter sp. ISL-50]MBT2778818.1 TPM domain-containing protein [Lysobacter sp. ISL-54]MBT2781414.1 TPM domain-containing protein [Lysobacter sp. ISL-52]
MRMLRHWFAPSSRRLFPEDSMLRIGAAIAAGEARHSGQLCFAVESRLSFAELLDGRQAREAALAAFAHLGVWDTSANNGVLLYLLLADHRIEIVADRGYDTRVGDERWLAVCESIQQALAAGEAEAAVLGGVAALSEIIAEQFPRADGGEGGEGNELPDRPARL